MPKRTRPPSPAALERAAQRFEKWRRNRSSRRAIPDGLWDLATELGIKYGVNRTKTALRLDYYGLKRRVEAACADGSGAATEPTFVELVPPSESATNECVVELEDPRGTKMRIQLKAAGVDEIAALGQLFWRREG